MTETGFAHFWSQGDAITRSVAVLLLVMSISAWVVILWKGWLLKRASGDVARSTAAFWQSGSITIERVSGPVGEALVMTAAGLAVAIPAVLAYNVFGKRVAASEADLEGFAHDLREMMTRDDEVPALAAAAARAGAAAPASSPASGRVV